MTTFVQLSGKNTLHHGGAERALWIANTITNATESSLHRVAQIQLSAKAAIKSAFTKWQAHRAAVQADEAMWAYAQQDPRLMAEIQARLGGR